MLKLGYKDKTILYDLYINQQKSSKEIATHFNVSNVTILNWLKKYKIKIRSQTKKNDFSHYVGKKYGELTIVKIIDYHTEPSGHKRKKIEVECSCGFQYETKLNYVIRKRGTKHCNKCGKKSLRLFKIGQKIDKLTIKKYITINKRTMVICDCDCGNINVLMRPSVIKINKTNNCGCDHRGSWTGEGEISKTFFYRIKRNAKIRNLTFNLNLEYLWKLFLKQKRKCALTNEPINFGFLSTDINTASLDRINSNKGYTKENVWWVHKDVNLMKMDLPLERFIEICRKVYENQQYDI